MLKVSFGLVYAYVHRDQILRMAIGKESILRSFLTLTWSAITLRSKLVGYWRFAHKQQRNELNLFFLQVEVWSENLDIQERNFSPRDDPPRQSFEGNCTVDDFYSAIRRPNNPISNGELNTKDFAIFMRKTGLMKKGKGGKKLKKSIKRYVNQVIRFY